VPAGFSSTASNPTITPSVATTYTVIVTNNQSGCYDEVSIEIDVLAAPEIPVITADENLLSSTVAESYQWYFNGTEIDGAVSQSYSANQTGNYQVEVWNADECSSISDNFNFEVSNVELVNNSAPQIYPNPNSGEFTIFAESEFTYQIVSAAGNVVATGKNSGTVDMSGFAGGVYYVVVKTDELVSTQKLIIVK
jgi:hypothetical protein